MPCILKDDIKKLRQAITDKGGMSAIRDMSAQDRINFFAKFVDMPKHTETAEWLNRQIEQRVLIPGQVQATKEWLKKLEKKGRPIKQKKAIIDRISAKKEVMNPKASRRYMESMAKQVMGFEISRDDAKRLFDLSTSINEHKKKLLSIKPNYLELTNKQLNELSGEALKARQELAEKLVEFQKTYEEISLKAQEAVIASKSKEIKLGGKTYKVNVGESLLKFAGNIKSLKASVDFSFLRQLQNTLYVNRKAFLNAWGSGYKAWFESQKGVDTMLGDLLTRPNALAGRYNDFGIEVGIKEEAFPESWASKKLEKYTPKYNVLRRSEAGFNIAIQTARANLFDWMWERSNGDVKMLKTEKIGDAINTITGRGKVPLLTSKDEKQNRIINNLLFAPKWLASRIETLTDLWYVRHLGKMTPKGIRARAAVGNAIMLGVLIPLIKAIGLAIDSDDERDFWEFLEQTFEPRSTDFGKIRIGTTRFDLSTGTAALLTLFSRVATGKTVTLAGVKSDTARGDVIWNFAKGKGAPALHTAAELITQTDYFGEDLKWNTAGEWAKNIMEFTAPISISSAYETSRNMYLGKTSGVNAFGQAVGVLSDIIGVSANTYDTKTKDLGKTDKVLQVEKRVAWATNKQPISAKLASNTVVMQDIPDDIAEERQLEFAQKLSVAENRLISSSKFKNASMEEKDEMLKEMRKSVYAEFKKDLGYDKKRLKKKK